MPRLRVRSWTRGVVDGRGSSKVPSTDVLVKAAGLNRADLRAQD